MHWIPDPRLITDIPPPASSNMVVAGRRLTIMLNLISTTPFTHKIQIRMFLSIQHWKLVAMGHQHYGYCSTMMSVCVCVNVHVLKKNNFFLVLSMVLLYVVWFLGSSTPIIMEGKDL